MTSSLEKTVFYNFMLIMLLAITTADARHASPNLLKDSPIRRMDPGDFTFFSEDFYKALLANQNKEMPFKLSPKHAFPHRLKDSPIRRMDPGDLKFVSKDFYKAALKKEMPFKLSTEPASPNRLKDSPIRRMDPGDLKIVSDDFYKAAIKKEMAFKLSTKPASPNRLKDSPIQRVDPSDFKFFYDDFYKALLANQKKGMSFKLSPKQDEDIINGQLRENGIRRAYNGGKPIFSRNWEKKLRVYPRGNMEARYLAFDVVSK